MIGDVKDLSWSGLMSIQMSRWETRKEEESTQNWHNYMS